MCILLQLPSVSAPYGQGYGGPATPTPSVFPTQQPQTAAKQFSNPSVPNFYPANSVAKPSIPQPFAPPVVPPKPFSPSPVVSAVSQPYGGYANPGQLSMPSAPGVTTQPSKFMVQVLRLSQQH